MRRGGGIEYVRYTYKFLNFIYYRTHSIAELIDQNQNYSLELLNLYKHRYHRTLNGNNAYSLAMGKKIIEDKNLILKIKNLIKNLDEASTKRVLTIVARLRASYLNPHHFITNLSEQELQELREIESEFFPNIFQVGDEAFYYNGYFLPIHHFEVGVFFRKHNLNLFSAKTL